LQSSPLGETIKRTAQFRPSSGLLAMASVIFADQLEIPFEVQDLAAFRRWALSDDFPERGRIDFIDGSIEVRMSPEDYLTHGLPKSEIARVLSSLVKQKKLGHILTDCTRISSPAADLSVEPDIVFISYTSLKSGLARLVPVASGEPGHYREVEGACDVAVEIVSSSSEVKDTKRLPVAYFKAGVREFWLVDARGKKLMFQIHRRGKSGFVPVKPDTRGYQVSSVFDQRFRLKRSTDEQGYPAFDLLTPGEE
jgi:Uma2 family endonuclease